MKNKIPHHSPAKKDYSPVVSRDLGLVGLHAGPAAVEGLKGSPTGDLLQIKGGHDPEPKF